MNETTSQTPRNVIVVGTDGSADGDRAIEYAVVEALRSHQTIRVVHVVPEAVPLTPMLPMFGADSLRAVGSQILADAAAKIGALSEDRVGVETVLAHGPRTTSLLAHTYDAALVVLGRRSSTLARIRTGSTTSAAASRADCPVIVVPEEWSASQHRGHVAAAVDGMPGNTDVVREALGAAHERGTDLVVVHAWRPVAPYDTTLGGSGTSEAWQRQTEPVVWAMVAGLRADYPDVEVRVDLRYQSTADALVAAGQDADLLVMGRRGEGAMFGTALGSKARAVLRSGACPVEVVPTRRPEPQDLPRQAERRGMPSEVRSPH